MCPWNLSQHLPDPGSETHFLPLHREQATAPQGHTLFLRFWEGLATGQWIRSMNDPKSQVPGGKR